MVSVLIRMHLYLTRFPPLVRDRSVCTHEVDGRLLEGFPFICTRVSVRELATDEGTFRREARSSCDGARIYGAKNNVLIKRIFTCEEFSQIVKNCFIQFTSHLIFRVWLYDLRVRNRDLVVKMSRLYLFFSRWNIFSYSLYVKTSNGIYRDNLSRFAWHLEARRD